MLEDVGMIVPKITDCKSCDVKASERSSYGDYACAVSSGRSRGRGIRLYVSVAIV